MVRRLTRAGVALNAELGDPARADCPAWGRSSETCSSPPASEHL